jgi:hypothetical protein
MSGTFPENRSEGQNYQQSENLHKRFRSRIRRKRFSSAAGAGMTSPSGIDAAVISEAMEWK